MLTVKICNGTSCYLKGAYSVIQLFQHEIEKMEFHDKIEIEGSFFLGQCQNEVSVQLNGDVYSVSPETAQKFFCEKILPLVE